MTERTQFTLRVETELLNKIKEIANDNKRSMTMQIEFILQEFVKTHKSK